MVRVDEPIWERLAREDAEFYIDVRRRDYASPAAMEAFFSSGEDEVSRILSESAPHAPDECRVAVEIGCGVGRLALAAAPRFAEYRAVDISRTMLAKLRANCEAAGIENVTGYLPEEGWDVGPIDFAFSRWVLQHIEEFAVIEGYVQRIAGALDPAGAAHLQFDTRPRNLGYRLRNRLPDAVLPRLWRRGIRRIRRTPEELAALFQRHGLQIVAEAGRGTTEHRVVLKRIAPHS